MGQRICDTCGRVDLKASGPAGKCRDGKGHVGGYCRGRMVDAKFDYVSKKWVIARDRDKGKAYGGF